MDKAEHRRDREKGRRLLHRFVRSRPHLTLAIAFGTVVGLAWPDSHPWLRRALIGWNAGVWVYLIGMAWMMARADHRKVRDIAGRQDESAGLVLFTLVVGAILSLYAIVSELTRMDHVPADQIALRYAFTALTVIGSWLLVGVLFCFHYAHLYYRAPRDHAPLRFPEEEPDGGAIEPDYWDFLYFSFTIAVAVQTSDVTVTSRSMRKLVLGHSVLAFFFNLLILGLSINIAAGFVNS
ncbi:DUF1345 domain-containing protein [Massilia norwichensis]|uniref:DUF1345 domain-containing protein n=1 Tax=Massilia norwichensis TaxID=1442366 RepID=A0ABT2A3N4_9BURK|nr:DUF1345 domain-containing protein [Massilia norwichensis]MCS0588818.1 DUF1345 domain-containing protein [Massilia norwichensis]